MSNIITPDLLLELINTPIETKITINDVTGRYYGICNNNILLVTTIQNRIPLIDNSDFETIRSTHNLPSIAEYKTIRNAIQYKRHSVLFLSNNVFLENNKIIEHLFFNFLTGKLEFIDHHRIYSYLEIVRFSIK